MNITHYVGEWGKEIIVDTETDISTATTTELHIEKPDGSTVTWTGEILTGDSELEDNRYVRYVTQVGDWDMEGTWICRLWIETTSWGIMGSIDQFKIIEP